MGLDSSWYPFHFLDSVHLLRITPILYSKKLIKYLQLRLSEVYIRLAKYLVCYFVSTLYVCYTKYGMTKQSTTSVFPYPTFTVL